MPPGWECVPGPDDVEIYVNYEERKMSFEPPSPLSRSDSDAIVLEDVKSEEWRRRGDGESEQYGRSH